MSNYYFKCALLVTVFCIVRCDRSGKQRKQQLHTPANSNLRERKPNIVLILTDDQDVELGSLNYMPKTLRAIRDQGANFRHAYVTTPMCCPSRSSLLTGMYVHNHNVYTNNDNCSSTQWQASYETRSFATYLSNAGYRTGYFGKYLNKYNGSYIPPGWREWGGLIMNSKYYNYSINMNGKKIKHGFDYYKDYYPDLITNDSIAFLRQSKKNSAHKPLMLTMSFPAPHGPEDSAPQYSHLFFNETPHHTPSYDYAPNPDKQWILQVTNKMKPIHKEFTNLLMTKRLQTLQSVDNAVERIVQELEALGELDNTFIIYTSDHGYHLGQFGLIKGKSFPFEFDVRVPFLVRGPGIEPGTEVNDILLNIDLAPTFLDIAGVEPPHHMDGRSVLPLFLNSKRKKVKWPDTFLIESSGRRETPYLDLKLKANKYTEKSNLKFNLTTAAPSSYFTESLALNSQSNFSTISVENENVTEESRIYDSLEDDVSNNSERHSNGEEDNGDESFISDDLDDFDVVEDFEETNIQLDGISQQNLYPENKFTRLSLECLQDNVRLPCKTGQKWYCENDNGRWRKHKCKSIKSRVTFSEGNNYRKCACFTNSGVIYRKIPIQNITTRDTRFGRIKRDVDLEDILFNSKRYKRDTLAHVDEKIDDVKGKINDLQANATFMEPAVNVNLETNSIIEKRPNCIRLNRGRINCSSDVYSDKKAWKISRKKIEEEIVELKEKLESLKEIKRHLILKKPTDETNHIRNATGINEFNELSIHHHHITGSITEDRQKFSASPNLQILPNNFHRTRKRKRPGLEENLRLPKRPKSGHIFTGSNFERPNITTIAPSVLHSNPHRHHHKIHYQTTKGYVDSRYIPGSTTEKLPSEVTKAPRRNICHCENKVFDDIDSAKEEKKRLKEDRLRKKVRKQKKREQLEKDCGSERMNCFQHDNDHWKTAPQWTSGPFCFCMNANNNTYSCVRTINSTHNFLYCEFTTGLITFYDLKRDPFELENRFRYLKPEERSFLHSQLKQLIACKGRSCTVSPPGTSKTRNNLAIQNIIPQQRIKRIKSGYQDSMMFSTERERPSSTIQLSPKGRGRDNPK